MARRTVHVYAFPYNHFYPNMKNQIISEQNPQHMPMKLTPAATAKSKADAFARAMKPNIDALHAEGITKPSSIATALILGGVATAMGGQWNTTLVLNLTRRLEVLKFTKEAA